MRKAAGFSLFEVLVTFVVSSIGLLGLASVQTLSVKNINNTQFRTLATLYAYNMAERMRSNQVAVEAGAYDAIDGSESAVSCNVCSAVQIAQQDAYEWNVGIKSDTSAGGLPEGNGTVTANNDLFEIVVSWKEQQKNDGGNLVDENFTLIIRI